MVNVGMDSMDPNDSSGILPTYTTLYEGVCEYVGLDPSHGTRSRNLSF